MFDPSTPDAFWLDITNAALGVFCALCLVAIAWAVVRDLLDKQAERSRERADSPSHILQSPELGLTMADGGRPIDTPAKNSDTQNQR
jgi:hypothetical protein